MRRDGLRGDDDPLDHTASPEPGHQDTGSDRWPEGSHFRHTGALLQYKSGKTAL